VARAFASLQQVILGNRGVESQTGRNGKGQSTYNSAMLKRLYIDNFRCFVNFEYKPERKQLLLGTNGSGKSSLLEAVRAIKEFVLETSTGSKTIFDSTTRTRWQNVPTQVFEIAGEDKGRSFSYRIETTISEKSGVNEVSAEILTVDGAVVVTKSKEGTNLGDGPAKLVPVSPRVKDISLVHFAKDYESVKAFLQWIDTLYCLRINPAAMVDSAVSEAKFPTEDFANIASYYRYLIQNDPEGNLGLITDLKEVLDSFQTFQFEDSDAGRRLIARFGSSSTSINFSLNELSDGQRSLIALYMILHFLIAKGNTVFLDEPDNFISLREIQPWLLAAEDAVEESKGQLILISHHPEILNQWAQEYGVHFVREENGQVRPPKRFKTDMDGLLQPSEVIARGWENE
jgi:predicted ATPase